MKFILAGFLAVILYLPTQADAGQNFWSIECKTGKLRKMKGSVSPPYYHCKQAKKSVVKKEGLSCGKFYLYSNECKKQVRGAKKHCCGRKNKKGSIVSYYKGKCKRGWKENRNAKKGQVCSKTKKERPPATKPYIKS